MNFKEKGKQVEYIDVRGPHPVYHKGMIVIRLIHVSRDVTVELAKQLLIATPDGRFDYE